MIFHDFGYWIFDDMYVLFGISSFIGILLCLMLRNRKLIRYRSKVSSFDMKHYPRIFYGRVESFPKRIPLTFQKPQSLFDKAKYSLSIVIPAYNEEKRLGIMLKDVQKILKAQIFDKNDIKYEIILVDDGSNDATVAEYKRIVSNFGPTPGLDFKLIKLRRNSGKGHAVSEGILASLGEYILFADADGSTDFESLKRFELIYGKENGDLLICGSRYHSQNSKTEYSVKRSIFRLFFMKAFHMYLKIFGVRSVQDTQCGFKLMNRSAARKIVPWIHTNGWIFDVEMILLAEWKGIKILEVPVNWTEMNGTKLRIAVDSVKMAKDLLLIRINYFLKLWKYEKTSVMKH